jgi:hypothetical protein
MQALPPKGHYYPITKPRLMGREKERERERERVPQGSLMINTTAFLLLQWSSPKETFNCYAAAAASASASAVAAVAICLQVLTDPFM